MTKRTVELVGLFFLSFAISILAKYRLENLIQTLFRKFTDNPIHHTGTEFYGISSLYYYLGFGLLVLIIWTSWTDITPKQKIFDGLFMIIIFLASITVITWIMSSGIIIDCDACENDIRAINYYKINYNGIVFISLFLSIIPSGQRVIKRKYAASAQQQL